MNVDLTPEAETDLADIDGWYRRQREDLGDRFGHAVEAALAHLESMPQAYPVVYQDIRRVLLQRFPYMLLYRWSGTDVLVIGCFHTARHPRTWRSRI